MSSGLLHTAVCEQHGGQNIHGGLVVPECSHFALKAMPHLASRASKPSPVEGFQIAVVRGSP